MFFDFFLGGNLLTCRFVRHNSQKRLATSVALVACHIPIETPAAYCCTDCGIKVVAMMAVVNHGKEIGNVSQYKGVIVILTG